MNQQKNVSSYQIIRTILSLLWTKTYLHINFASARARENSTSSVSQSLQKFLAILSFHSMYHSFNSSELLNFDKNEKI